MRVFKNTQKEEVGGFKSLEIIRIEDVLNCPKILTNLNVDNFIYTQFLAEDVEIMPAKETIIVKASPKKTTAGTLFTISSKFEVAYPNATIDTIFNTYLLEKVIVKANKYNGVAMIYGSLEHPLEFLYEVVHSKKYETNSKFEVSISGKIPQKPVFTTV